MRTIFLSFLAVIMSISTFAQTSEHMSFKGVPIDGTLNEYVAKMKQNGFQYLGTEDGTAILNGDFAGYKNCHVGVTTLNKIDLVHKIGVIFPNQETWSRLFSNYSDLKQMLTEKYGNPNDEVELFDVKSFQLPLDDNSKMHQVKMDRCNFYAVWKTDKGEIQLAIDHSGFTSCFVKVGYFDKINSAIINEKAKDDL
ncbi:MAG: hypothetical protein FJX80_06560 [Bacteroidetes bacterium]|nr:hypothetical protein [Bacteroidota bacterium]